MPMLDISNSMQNEQCTLKGLEGQYVWFLLQ
jgi:hypothetical protein